MVFLVISEHNAINIYQVENKTRKPVPRNLYLHELVCTDVLTMSLLQVCAVHAISINVLDCWR